MKHYYLINGQYDLLLFMYVVIFENDSRTNLVL